MVGRLELAAIDSNQMIAEKPQLLAQHDELTTHASNGLAVVFAEVGDGLEIRHQTPGQPHQLDIALRFALEANPSPQAPRVAACKKKSPSSRSR